MYDLSTVSLYNGTRPYTRDISQKKEKKRKEGIQLRKQLKQRISGHID